MNDFSELINLIESNPSNWQSILKNKPYSLRSIKQSAQNPNWYILMYNLFERNSLKYKEVLASRGTVVEVKDGKAKIICAPFYKFFNFKECLEEKIDFSNPKCFCCQKKDGWICVSGDSEVETENGKKTIKEVVEGNDRYILSFNPLTKEIEYAEIEEKHTDSEKKKWYEIETESGKKIKITGEDLLAISNGSFRKVKDLNIGDELIIKE